MLKFFVFACVISSFAYGSPLPKDASEFLTKESREDEASSAAATFEELPDKLLPPRRQVNYDQRQDGKYNIRADLENFVILVVPSSSSSGLSLLDFFRSAQGQKRSKHGHKKYHGASVKAATPAKPSKLDYLRPESEEPRVETVQHAVDDFIEGRTPYRVDISSSEMLQSKKPIEIIESVESSPKSILLRTLLNGQSPMVVVDAAQSVKGNDFPFPTIQPTNSRFRKSLTIEGMGNNIMGNSVLLTSTVTTNGQAHGVAVDDTEDDQSEHEFYDLTDTSNSFDSLNVGNLDQLGLADPAAINDNYFNGANPTAPQWQLTLLGAQEQCGPDRKRDSYGICQFVPQDYSP